MKIKQNTQHTHIYSKDLSSKKKSKQEKTNFRKVKLGGLFSKGWTG